MIADNQASERPVTVHVKLGAPEWELRTTMSVPKGPMRLGELLPLVQSFGDTGAGPAAKSTLVNTLPRPPARRESRP